MTSEFQAFEAPGVGFIMRRAGQVAPRYAGYPVQWNDRSSARRHRPERLAGVVARYIFNDSFTWTEELGSWLFVALIFIGVASSHRRRRHIAITTFIELFSPTKQAALDFVSDAIIAYTAIFMLFSGSELLGAIGGTSLGLEWPNWLQFVGIPIGAALSSGLPSLAAVRGGALAVFGVSRHRFRGAFYWTPSGRRC